VVVHGHEHELPADFSPALGAIAGDAMAHLVETPELLDVDVQQLARVLTLVALYGLLWPQIAQPGQPGAAQYPADRCLGYAHVGGNARLQHQLAAQLHDGQRHVRLDGSGRALRPRGFVQQAGSAIGQVTAQPFAGSDGADAMLGASF
jgi:hypothetical protein